MRKFDQMGLEKYRKLEHITPAELTGWLARAPENYVKALEVARAAHRRATTANQPKVTVLARPAAMQPRRADVKKERRARVASAG